MTEDSNQKKAKKASLTARIYEKLARKGHTGAGTTPYSERAADKRHAEGIYRHVDKQERDK